MTNPPDAIERSTEIDRDADTVFDLISRPGWWINDGTLADNAISTDGDICTVTHAEYGDFRIRIVAHDRPHYASFRWLAGESHRDSHQNAAGTLIEFFLEDRPGGVILRVRESGFTELPFTAEQRLKTYRENETGWESELQAAKKYVEAG